MPSETFKRFLALHPGWVGYAGHVELDGYRIDVADIPEGCRWWLACDGHEVQTDIAVAPAPAWQQACNALDRHKAQLDGAV